MNLGIKFAEPPTPPGQTLGKFRRCRPVPAFKDKPCCASSLYRCRTANITAWESINPLYYMTLLLGAHRAIQEPGTRS